MIEVKVNGKTLTIKIAGDAFEAANDAVNVAIRLAEQLGKADAALGYAVRKCMIDELSKGLPAEETEEAE